MKISIIRWLSLLGSLAMGAASVLHGDTVTGAGIIAAAFSSLPGDKLPQ